jgi:outer membrane efflux protein
VLRRRLSFPRACKEGRWEDDSEKLLPWRGSDSSPGHGRPSDRNHDPQCHCEPLRPEKLRHPTIDLNSYYGDVGPSPENSHGVFSVIAALNFNIYTGGHIRADTEKARAALKQRTDELADLGARIEVEVREAFLDLRSTADQVAVAQDNLRLANHPLIKLETVSPQVSRTTSKWSRHRDR